LHPKPTPFIIPSMDEDENMERPPLPEWIEKLIADRFLQMAKQLEELSAKPELED
jgi:hypothetical protein